MQGFSIKINSNKRLYRTANLRLLYNLLFFSAVISPTFINSGDNELLMTLGDHLLEYQLYAPLETYQYDAQEERISYDLAQRPKRLRPHSQEPTLSENETDQTIDYDPDSPTKRPRPSTKPASLLNPAEQPTRYPEEPAEHQGLVIRSHMQVLPDQEAYFAELMSIQDPSEIRPVHGARVCPDRQADQTSCDAFSLWWARGNDIPLLDEPEVNLLNDDNRASANEMSASSSADREHSGSAFIPAALFPKTFYPCPYRCDFCTESVCVWLKHLFSEHQETVAKCPYEDCSYMTSTTSYSKKNSLESHINAKHVMINSKRTATKQYPCLAYTCLPGCDFRTLSVHSWQKHLYEKHNYTELNCPFENCTYKANITSRVKRTALDNHVRRKHS